MSSPKSDGPNFSSPPRSIRIDSESSTGRREDSAHRHSPTLIRSFDYNDEDARERQRAMDVDSALQLSRSRSASIPIPRRPSARGSNPSHGLPSISSADSSPRLSSLEARDIHFPTLSASEEQDMHLARNGGGVAVGSYPYQDEPENITDHLDMTGSNGREHDDDIDVHSHSRHRAHSRPVAFDSSILLNHHDPMLDSRTMKSLNPSTAGYNPHEPIIGSLGSHDPMLTGPYSAAHQLSSGSKHVHLDDEPSTFTSESSDRHRHGSQHPEQHEILAAALPPMYQPTHDRSNFDYSFMESFAAEQREHRLNTSPAEFGSPNGNGMGAEIRRRLAQSGILQKEDDPGLRTNQKFDRAADGDLIGVGDSNGAPVDAGLASSAFVQRRQRKLSHSNPNPRRQAKLAMFEGGMGSPSTHHSPPQLDTGLGPNMDTIFGGSRPPAPQRNNTTDSGHDRPYRFSFYSNAMSATIHARSLSELPAEGQTFEDLFLGRVGSGINGDAAGSTNNNSNPNSNSTATPARTPRPGTPADAATNGGSFTTPAPLRTKEGLLAKATTRSNIFNTSTPGSGGLNTPGDVNDDPERSTWWLDILSPTDEEMQMLSKVFSIHPLTTEDIQMEETREKIELFRNYYFVCFRGFDQDVYSPTHLEPLNMYVIVFREGTLSFHFRGTPHPQNVRRRIKQLKDYINVTADWISYALIDDITDAFGPLIQNIEYEVDSIDELVLILKDAEQSDMLRRIGTCRKKVMGLLRLMGNKADVVKGLAKRCNENWSVAPKSDIGLYLSDIQDHLVTMTQNLNHYEKILSRSHSNYLAQISIEMTDANNQINDVLSKLTALGTVLVPMNLITGLWGMNVHVPGQDIEQGYVWFCSIIGGLVGFAVLGFIFAYKLMVSR